MPACASTNGLRRTVIVRGLAEQRAIEWRAFLRAKGEDSANKLVSRLQETLGQSMRVTELARYWKDDALYECEFTTPLADGSPAETTQAALMVAGQLAPIWNVGGIGAGGDLWGVADRGIIVSGVEWLHFQLGRSQHTED
jgi:hypothetical protein